MRDPRLETRVEAQKATTGRWLTIAGALSLILFFGGPLSANQGMVTPLAGFAAFAIGGILGLVCTVVGLVKTFRRGLRAGRAGVLLGIVPAALLLYGAVGSAKSPPINDITTDLENPPAFLQASQIPANRERDMSYPPSFKPIVKEAYPDLQPLELPVPPEKAFDLALLVAQGTPRWNITLVDRNRLFFEGHETTPMFHFRDDFVVRVTRHGGGSRVDMRSKSRDGRGDLGANAERIRSYLAKLKASL